MKPREACGVVAVSSRTAEPARLAFFALYALQHRGQESAGICTANGESLNNLTGMGLVSQVFHERNLARLGGQMAIGHTRYSTTGSSRADNAQPIVVGSDLGSLALAHNGNLVNIETIRTQVARLGIRPRTSTDSELIAHLISRAPGDDWLERMRHVLQTLSGAFCLVMLTRDRVYAARDPWGIRPMVLGRLADGWAVASESCALDTIGAQLIREVAPGELLAIGPEGIHAEQFSSTAPPVRAGCSFEFIYFARPDSLIDGQLVYSTRERMGEALAREHPVAADFVMPVPDSATPAAIGFARAAGIPYREGLVKAISLPERQLCNACFHGRYPMAIDGATEKLSLEQARP